MHSSQENRDTQALTFLSLSTPTGRRVCPGQHVAERAIYIAVTVLLHHFTISNPEGIPPPDIFAFTDGFNSRAEPFAIKVEPRGEGIRELVKREQDDAWESLRTWFFSCYFLKVLWSLTASFSALLESFEA